MILEYFRPKDLNEALNLLSRQEPPMVIPLGGGTQLSHADKLPVAVVDLQDLPLNQIYSQGNNFKVGATVTLQKLSSHPQMPPALVEALHHEATLHIRSQATVAGQLVTADGRSPFTTALLALDARIFIEPGARKISLGDWLPQRSSRSRSELITEIDFPIQAAMSFEMIGRSPGDRPMVCVAIGVWPSGRTRVALGGIGDAPILAMDGPEGDGADTAVENAFMNATDAFASGEYRSHAAKVIVSRLLSLGAKKV